VFYTTRSAVLRPLVVMFALVAGPAWFAACTDADPAAPERQELAPVMTSAAVAKASPGTAQRVDKQTADVLGQGPAGPVVASDGATLRRTAKGISASLSMPTPEPGTYIYPSTGVAFSGPGHPEAFTLWVFVFDDPEDPDWTGAFLGGGHLVGGPNLTLSGQISRNTEPFLGEPLRNPEGARVLLAVAPHGALNPELLPAAIQTPTGPGPDIWWLALFD
jgi:hypothetical protein